MAQRPTIDDRIAKKTAEIQELEMKIREAKAYLQALNDVAKTISRDESVGAEQETSLRPGSSVAEAREAILKAGKPLHISDILKASGKEMTSKSRAALAGSISAYVRRGEIFTRPRPNTFGLTELSSPSPSSPEQSPSRPPATFGLVSKDKE